MGLYNWLDASALVRNLYDQMRRGDNAVLDWEEPEHALHLCFYLAAEVSDYVNDKYIKGRGKRVYAFAHFILTSQHRVYFYHGDKDRVWNIPAEAWVNTSNHDSCWLSDGFQTPMSKLYFDMCDQVQSHLPPAQRVAPMYVDFSATLGGWLAGKPLSFVKIKRGVRRQDNDYLDTLTSVKPLKIKIQLEEEKENASAKTHAG